MLRFLQTIIKYKLTFKRRFFVLLLEFKVLSDSRYTDFLYLVPKKRKPVS